VRLCPKCGTAYESGAGVCLLDGTSLDGIPDPFLGKTFHAYVIVEAVGRGAAGQVYKARHEFLGTTHAVKVLGVAGAVL
jgi:serine/threonine protein kinase